MLIETSAWIAFYRNDPVNIAVIIENWLVENQPIFTTPLIMQEVLQGFSDDQIYQQALSTFQHYEIFQFEDQKQAAIGAANIYRSCRKKGFTIRKPNDCMIAHIAMSFNLPLIHCDKDFDHIAKVYPELKIVQV